MNLHLSLYRRSQASQVITALMNPAAEVHQHVDWQDLRQWLYERGLLMALAWRNRELVGVLAFAPPYRGSSHIRLLILPGDDRQAVLAALWDYLRPHLQAGGVQQVAAIGHQDWLPSVLDEYGFYHQDSVVHLYRPPGPPPPPLMTIAGWGPKIRGVWRWEWGRVLSIDQAAFGPPWQFRPADFRFTAREASLIRVAIVEGQMAAYQLSRVYRDNLHLIRLATLPAYQNRGLARALLHDLLAICHRWGIPELSVNTQASNVASRHLYESFGFQYEESSTGVYLADFH